jgi:PAS domain-containing protein
MLIWSFFSLFCSFLVALGFFTFSLILIVLPYSDFMGLGGINNIFNTGNCGTSCSVSNLGNEPIALNLIGKEVDPFTNSDSRSPLEQMANQLKDYEKVIDINDPEQVALLKDSKAVLEEMRRNLEAGKTSLEKVNKYISDSELIQKISQRTKELFDRRSTWLTITGTEQLSSNFQQKINDRTAIAQDIQEAQESLENLSSAEIEELKYKYKEAINNENDIDLLTDPVVAKTTSILQANKSMQEKFNRELLGLQNRLEDSNLTQEQRQSAEQRIEKIEKAIELLKKIENDKDFQDKIWSQLSEEEKKSILEDIKDGELTKKSTQVINIATAAADKTQTINEGLFASSKQGMKDMTGSTHEEYFEEYRVPMNLDKSEFIKTNIDLKVYSRDSAYDSSSYSSNVANKNEGDPKDSNLSPEQKVANIILELESRGALTPAELNLTNKDIAQRLGLKPDHPIVLAIVAGNYDAARKLSIGLNNIETSVNAIAAPDPVDPWGVISLTPEGISSLDPLGGSDFFKLSFA